MPRMGDLAAQDAYDVPLDQSTGVGWANRAAEALYAKPQYDENPLYKTASPLVNISEGDIGRATEAAMGVSGGGLSTKPIKAYHSSPHDFDKFDLAKIGSGEGAQVYGHGLYFAENPAVSGQGGEYWKQFLPRFTDSTERAAAVRLQQAGFDRIKAVEAVQRDMEAARRRAQGSPNDFYRDVVKSNEAQIGLLSGDKPVGPRTYEVNINADPAHMLDWDKVIAANDPLRQMVAGSARTAFDRATTGANRNIAKDALLAAEGESLTGQGVYEQLARTNTRPGLFPEINLKQPARASEMLREAGIPGIRYLDQGSRLPPPDIIEKINAKQQAMMIARKPETKAVIQAEIDALKASVPQGTNNYVIFDPNIIDIMKKYGIAGAAPAGMGALAAQDAYRGE